MARWFRADNTADLDKADLTILNRAANGLISRHGMSPTVRNLTEVRMSYKRGMSAANIIDAFNDSREERRVATINARDAA